MTTTVTDTTDWLLAVPLEAAPGTVLDFAGTRVRIAFAQARGGPPIATADTTDGTLSFVPAANGVPAYFAIDLRVSARELRVAAPLYVFGDLEREPDPLHPERKEWLGRIALCVVPGTGSAAIAQAGLRPVLTPAQPYGGRVAADPLLAGPQGALGALPPAPADAASKTYTLALVNGTLSWRAAA